MRFKPVHTVFVTLFFVFKSFECNVQAGPDPWDSKSAVNSKINENIPPDLLPIPPKKIRITGNNDWFYKRLLAILLKGGQIKQNEDGSVDISLQMLYTEEKWNTLKEYINLDTNLSEDMYRRSLGYVEESIYKPTITERMVWAWHECIQYYLVEYKTEIMWILSFITMTATTFFLWNHVSHRHVIITVFVGLYIYEAFISYKDAEKQEMEKFMKAVNTCKWYIWSSTCEVPPPDPLIFLKYLNPMKILVRMLSTLVTEPMLLINETVKIMLRGITDGLWYPMDQIMFGLLITIFNVLLIFLLTMIVFNFILNIHFDLNFLGIIGIALKQRKRYFQNDDTEKDCAKENKNDDRISEANFSKLLDVCTSALNIAGNARPPITNNLTLVQAPAGDATMRRSSSAGRIHDLKNNDHSLTMLKDLPPKRIKKMLNGGGDAL